MFKLYILFLLSAPINSWVINNIEKAQLKKHLTFEWNLEEEGDVEKNNRLALIYPGTKWCGAGDVAENYDDLGSERETDICCRDHDYCPDYIAAGEAKHNLTNDAFYTRLTCECDEQFRVCLRNAHSKTANSIGRVYFNGLATKCYRKDYPITGCVKKGGWLNRKCLEYSYDENGEQTYQWFYVSNY